MGPKHVAAAAEPHRHAVRLPTAGNVGDSVVGDDRRADVVLHAGTLPQLFARVGGQSEDLSLHAHDQFFPATGRRGNDRCAPRALDALESPGFLSVGFVESDDRAALNAGIDDHQILMKYNGSTRPPLVQPATHVGLPHRLAGHGEGKHPGLTGEHVDLLAVGGGGARRVTVERQKAAIVLFGHPRLDLASPNEVAGFKVDGEEVQPEIFLVAGLALIEAVARVGGDEHLVAPGDRTGITGTRQGDHPGHVGDARPMGRHFRLGGRGR